MLTSRANAWVERARWFDPDASLEALDAASVRGLEDRADELAGALGIDAPGPLEVVRSVSEATERWLDAWARAEAAPNQVAPPWLKRLADAIPEDCGYFRGDVPDPGVSTRDERLFDDLLATLRSRSGAWAAWRRATGSETLPITSLIWCDVVSATLHPAAAMRAFWDVGVWPALRPDGGLMVYVPVRHEGDIVLDPSGPVRASRLWRERGTSARHVERLGLGPPRALAPTERIVSSRGALVVECGPVRQQVERVPFEVGRSLKGDLVIRDSNVSRVMMRVTLIESEFWFEDCASSGGIFFGGVKVQRRQVEHGDAAGLCDHRVRFVFERGSSPEKLP